MKNTETQTPESLLQNAILKEAPILGRNCNSMLNTELQFLKALAFQILLRGGKFSNARRFSVPLHNTHKIPSPLFRIAWENGFFLPLYRFSVSRAEHRSGQYEVLAKRIFTDYLIFFYNLLFQKNLIVSLYSS